MRFSSKSNGFRGSSSKDKEDGQKICYNCNKLGHFRADCPYLQKDKSNKGSFQNDNFINKFKKSLMTTWGELGNEESSDKDEGKANLALIALTSLMQIHNHAQDRNQAKKIRYFLTFLILIFLLSSRSYESLQR